MSNYYTVEFTKDTDKQSMTIKILRNGIPVSNTTTFANTLIDIPIESMKNVHVQLDALPNDPTGTIPPNLSCPFCGGYVRGHQWIGTQSCSITDMTVLNGSTLWTPCTGTD